MSSNLNNDELDYFTENIKAEQPNSVNPSNSSNSAQVETTEKVLPVDSSKSVTKNSYKNLVNLVVIGLGTSLAAYFGYSLMSNQSVESIESSATVNQVVVDNNLAGSTVSEATSLLDNSVAEASVYFSVNNTFKGFKSGNSVKVAANADSIVLVVTVDGECYSNGIASGYDSVTRFDPTGKRCSKKNFKSLQKLMAQ